MTKFICSDALRCQSKTVKQMEGKSNRQTDRRSPKYITLAPRRLTVTSYSPSLFQNFLSHFSSHLPHFMTLQEDDVVQKLCILFLGFVRRIQKLTIVRRIYINLCFNYTCIGQKSFFINKICLNQHIIMQLADEIKKQLRY